MSCQFKNGHCKEPAVKGDKLCRKHKYYVNKQCKKPFKLLGDEPTIRKNNVQNDFEETTSVLSFASDASESVDITRQFVFQCITEYFEEHKKRQELIEGFGSKSKKKSGGMDLNSILGIGAMSLLPILTKQLNLAELFNKSNIDNDRDKQEDFINLPKRPAKPEAPPTERPDNIKYEKV